MSGQVVVECGFWQKIKTWSWNTNFLIHHVIWNVPKFYWFFRVEQHVIYWMAFAASHTPACAQTKPGYEDYTRFDPGWRGWRVKSYVLRTDAANDSCCSWKPVSFCWKWSSRTDEFSKNNNGDSDCKIQNFIISPPWRHVIVKSDIVVVHSKSRRIR